jgi:hypothetical protein
MTTIRQNWLNEGRAKLLPIQISHQFRDYADSLPWTASTLNWSLLQPYTTINIATASKEALVAWAKGSAIGKRSHLALCFSPNEQCFLVGAEDGVRHIDELFWGSPGVSFCFGVDMACDDIHPHFRDLLQYGAGDILFAKSDPSSS